MNILSAVADKSLFARWFERGDWTAWRAFLGALFGLPLSPEQLAIYQQHTGRATAPAAAFAEAWLICGRRAGKSFTLALTAVFLATFRSYREYLQPGERATILILAADRKQARVILRYVQGLLHGVPMLTRLIERQTADGFDLTNAVTVEVGTASFRTTRGYSFAAVLADEIAFWSVEGSAEPDTEILAAIRPGMSTIPGAMLLCASSPYARRGALWEAHKRYHAIDGAPILIWQADTKAMNPGVPASVIAEAYERDPASAAAEYGAQFRSDVESLLTREAIAACVEPGTLERPHRSGKHYVAFVDPSGGSSDSMTMAIAHREGDHGLLDVTREVSPPFSPEAVVAEFALTLRNYGIGKITGDAYSGQWCREAFSRHGIEYVLSDANRSELYLNLLPWINSRSVCLLDIPRLEQQLIGLERRTARSGRDSIDHAPGCHDDLANSAAGALYLAMRPVHRPTAIFGVYGCEPDRYSTDGWKISA